MYVARSLRMSAAAVAVAVTISTVGATAAEAGKPGPAPSGLGATVAAHPNGTYDVASSWNAVAGATSYRVVLTKGGATLSSATLTAPSWTSTVSSAPGDASLSVRAVVGKRPGKTATLTVPLPDKTPPTGAFHATFNGNTGHADIAITTPVSDNSGGAVTASVDWKDGTPPQSWNLAADIAHDYALVPARYVPVVTLTDSSNNENPVVINAVVILDSTAPTGTFSVSPTAAWASFTTVTLTQTALHDVWSPNDKIARSVNWGDGSGAQTWTTGSTLTHTYALAAGTSAADFTPAVSLTDEAGNTTNPGISAGAAVHVTADTHGPWLRLTLPKKKTSVRAWRTLRGLSNDAETGVKSVWLKAVEKRRGAWFGYNSVTHRWIKTKSKSRAFSKARAFTLTTNARHQWSAKLVGLRKGTLMYKVRATDHVNNQSATLSHKATLKKR